jgi:death-on-curing protein
MSEPVWIRDDVVRAIHLRQLAEHGGAEGIRDPGLLESALAKPRNLLAYCEPEPDIAGLAASYAFGIIRNHPFVDGNKRTGFVVCRVYLRLNGYDIDASPEDKYVVFLKLAEGRLSEQELAEWIRDRLMRLQP